MAGGVIVAMGPLFVTGLNNGVITVNGTATGNECYVGEGTNAAVTGVIQTCCVSG